jgi:hypothetical protein
MLTAYIPVPAPSAKGEEDQKQPLATKKKKEDREAHNNLGSERKKQGNQRHAYRQSRMHWKERL